MDEGQLSELTDSENWRHLYTRLHSLADSRKTWQMSALLSLLLPVWLAHYSFPQSLLSVFPMPACDSLHTPY